MNSYLDDFYKVIYMALLFLDTPLTYGHFTFTILEVLFWSAVIVIVILTFKWAFSNGF